MAGTFSFFGINNCLQLAIIQKNAGHLNHVLHYYDDLLKTARENNMESSGVVGGFYSEMGDIYSEQYNFETATPYLQKGLESAEICKDSFQLWTAYKNQARSLLYQNKFQEALNAIERINVLVEKNPLPPWFISISNGVYIQILLKTNKLDQAVKMIECQQLSVNNPLFHFQEAVCVAYARVLIEQGNFDDALALLDRLLEIATADNRGRPEIEMHILKALTLANQNRNRNAVKEIGLALSKAQNNSFISIFISEGMLVKTLIQKAVYSKSKSTTFFIDFAEKVIEIFESKESIFSDILSERELEVLQCVASGMKNSQIADNLFVSMNTIKTHLKNIILKLEVKNRTEAVTQGRKMGWLKK